MAIFRQRKNFGPNVRYCVFGYHFGLSSWSSIDHATSHSRVVALLNLSLFLWIIRLLFTKTRHCGNDWQHGLAGDSKRSQGLIGNCHVNPPLTNPTQSIGQVFLGQSKRSRLVKSECAMRREHRRPRIVGSVRLGVSSFVDSVL